MAVVLRSYAFLCATVVACADDPALDRETNRSEPDDEGPGEPEPSDRGSDRAQDAGAARRDAGSPHDAASAGQGRKDAAADARVDSGAASEPAASDSGETMQCADPQIACGAQCVDARDDARHCGACDKRCASGERCEDGSCRAEASCSDSCPRRGGVEWACKARFMYGVNYAWHHFGADFGGNAAWKQPGVSQNSKVEADLAAFAAHGVSVVRWWLFPDFRGDGISFDAQDAPTGLGGTFAADLERALELAQDYDLYLMPTLFSFDNFRPTKNADGRRSRGIRDMLRDEAKRKALLERVVRPIAKAAAASRNARRVIAWDVINEPEWAIQGASLYGGDPAFDPNPELEAVSHMEMESFLREVIAVLRAESEALISVGGTAIKWRHAWSKLDVDFHQFHIYDWVNMYWPYNRSPKDYGVDDKPVVMGEFPARGLTGVNYETLLGSWYMGGYQGALAWAYTDPMFGGPGMLADVKRFAERHPCDTQY